jgi:hypothetical protein
LSTDYILLPPLKILNGERRIPMIITKDRSAQFTVVTIATSGGQSSTSYGMQNELSMCIFLVPTNDPNNTRKVEYVYDKSWT